MIITVDTEKESAAGLRKAAKILQDFADSKEGPQPVAAPSVPTAGDIRAKRVDLFEEQPKEEPKKKDFNLQVY